MATRDSCDPSSGFVPQCRLVPMPPGVPPTLEEASAVIEEMRMMSGLPFAVGTHIELAHVAAALSVRRSFFLENGEANYSAAARHYKGDANHRGGEQVKRWVIKLKQMDVRKLELALAAALERLDNVMSQLEVYNLAPHKVSHARFHGELRKQGEYNETIRLIGEIMGLINAIKEIHVKEEQHLQEKERTELLTVQREEEHGHELVEQIRLAKTAEHKMARVKHKIDASLP